MEESFALLKCLSVPIDGVKWISAGEIVSANIVLAKLSWSAGEILLV